MLSHLTCLSESFVSKEFALIPTSGSCPVCLETLKWGDLISEMNRRSEGNNLDSDADYETKHEGTEDVDETKHDENEDDEKDKETLVEQENEQELVEMFRSVSFENIDRAEPEPTPQCHSQHDQEYIQQEQEDDELYQLQYKLSNLDIQKENTIPYFTIPKIFKGKEVKSGGYSSFRVDDVGNIIRQ